MDSARIDPSADHGWAPIYMIGAVAAVATLVGTLCDIAITAMPGWAPSTAPTSVVGWFEQFQTKPLLGLRNLDLLNVIVSIAAIPMYVAFYGAHRRRSQGLATLGLVTIVVGTSVLVSNNAALPMLDLSRQLTAATTDAQRLALQGAAHAVLAAGAHGSMGAFMGFSLASVGALVMAFAALTGGVFSRRSAWIGVGGASLLLAYVIGATFRLAPASVLLLIALPGGLLMTAWNVIVAKALLRVVATS